MSNNSDRTLAYQRLFMFLGLVVVYVMLNPWRKDDLSGNFFFVSALFIGIIATTYITRAKNGLPFRRIVIGTVISFVLSSLAFFLYFLSRAAIHGQSYEDVFNRIWDNIPDFLLLCMTAGILTWIWLSVLFGALLARFASSALSRRASWGNR